MSSPNHQVLNRKEKKKEKKEEARENEPVQPQQPQAQSKLYTFVLRFITGLIMIIGFLILLNTSHVIITCFVICLQILVFREIIALRYKEAKEKNLFGFRTLNWYFLFITMYFVYGVRFLTLLSERYPIPSFLIERHNWHSFVLYIIGFCGFVFSLRRQTLKYQFGQITWTIMTLLLVVVQSHFILKNIHEGLIWLILPHSLIICNDIWAYFVGVAIGKKFIKRPLTPLSPNKSWEGFFGAIIITVIYSLIAARIFGDIEWFRCSSAQLESEGGCAPGYLFTPYPMVELFKDYIPNSLFPYLKDIYITRMQIHSVIFALFSSIIAPFGGFFASAMKRAYQKKDFDQIIPGHGGATDRFDCQFIIGLFTFVYYTTWIKSPVADIDSIITVILGLPLVDRQRIIQILQQSL